MKSKRLCSTLLCMGMGFFLNLPAQEILQHSAKSYVDSINQFYVQAELPVYIYVATSPGANPHMLANKQKVDENGAPLPLYLDGHGKHYLNHVDALHRREDRFAIFADGIAPVSQSKFKGGSKSYAQGQVYYGKGLVLELVAYDEMSGLENVYYSLNQSAYQPYLQELPIQTSGTYELNYYAVDHVGNVESPHQLVFTLDTEAPQTYHNVIGISQNKIISTSTQLYLSFEDDFSGVDKTYYYFDQEAEKPYLPKTRIPFTYLSDGEHTLYYYSTDRVGNREALKTFDFYLDKSSPIMSADVLGDRFIVEDKVYFSGRTKLKLTAVDNKSGIKTVLYSIDGEKYKEYKDPFYLPKKSGLHTIRYYAVDSIGNQGVSGNVSTKVGEYEHNAGQVYVDLTGPILSHIYKGATFQKGDTLYISGTTQLILQAYDPESGLQKITFAIDNDLEESLYENPVQLPSEGRHQIRYFGYDNVNNRNVDDFYLVVDTQGPDLLYNFSTEALEGPEVYPSYVTLFLAAVDGKTTIQDISYSINGQSEKKYTQPIDGFEKNKAYTLQVKVTDKLGNETQTKIEFSTGDF